MNIRMIGIDHSMADVDCRANFSFTKTGAAAAAEEYKKEPGIRGCVILSTCNRTEIWISAEDEAQPDLYGILCRLRKTDPAEYRECFITRENEEAVRHLFETTGGLNSMILGEDQILTQVKQALQIARDAYTTDPVIETLFRMAITGGKKVKSGMQCATANLSAIEAAIAGLKQRGYDFRGRRCLVIGNGEMGRRSAQALTAEGVDVTVTVRQYHSGTVQIPTGCKRINYGDRCALIPECDLVVSATSSPNRTVRMDMLERMTIDRDQIYIDLAVPRDIELEVGELPRITLYDIDSFSVAESEEQMEMIRRARRILSEQVEEFLTWYECRDLIPAVRTIGRREGQEVFWRTGKTVKKLALEEQDRAALEEAVTTASSKVIEKLLFTIRDEAGTDVFRQCLEALRGEADA